VQLNQPVPPAGTRPIVLVSRLGHG
jgi:hypothetical protein